MSSQRLSQLCSPVLRAACQVSIGFLASCQSKVGTSKWKLVIAFWITTPRIHPKYQRHSNRLCRLCKARGPTRPGAFWAPKGLTPGFSITESKIAQVGTLRWGHIICDWSCKACQAHFTSSNRPNRPLLKAHFFLLTPFWTPLALGCCQQLF